MKKKGKKEGKGFFLYAGNFITEPFLWWMTTESFQRLTKQQLEDSVRRPSVRT